MRKLLPVLVLLSGCGYVERAKQKVGLVPTSQQLQADADAQAARERIEKEKKLQQLREADALTAKWADKLLYQPGHFQSITEQDPWGSLIRYEYTQEGLDEVITATSLGPDAQPGTEDDLRHSRSRPNLWGAHRGYGILPFLLLGWVTCGLLALLATGTRGKRKQKKNPVISGLAIVVASPIIVICCAFMVVVQVVGGIFGGDGDGPDLDFDLFDFDFDIFGD